MKKVGIIMGSDSDLPVVEKAIKQLKGLLYTLVCFLELYLSNIPIFSSFVLTYSPISISVFIYSTS